MKHTFKKVAAILLVALMCVSTMTSVFAADTVKCPGVGARHDKNNCTYVQVSEQNATCEAKGFVTARCVDCSAIFNLEEIPAKGHDWSDIVPATCDAPSTRTCKVCNTKITVSPKLTHLYTAYVVSGGVCKSGERISRTCVYCGLEDKKIIGVEGHEYALTSYVEPSNCVTPGQAKYTCVVNGCGVSKVIPIKADNASVTAHNYNHWVTVKGESVKDPNRVEPSCTASGRASIVCTRCDDIKIISLGKKTHTYSALQEAKPATCVTTGFQAYYYCVDCRAYFDTAKVQKEYSELIIPAHHNNPEKLTITIEVNPSCSLDGWRYVSCTECTTYKDQPTTLSRYAGHLYYANVTKKEDKINILKALSLYTTDADVDTIWNNLGKVDFSSTGKDKVWKNYTPATCTSDALVTWICLNCSFNQKNNAYEKTACDVGYTVTPSGEDYVKTGHKFVDVYPSTNTHTGVAYVDNPPATCVAQGIRVYDCVNEYIDANGNLVGCTVTDNKVINPLGHKWEKADSATINGVLTTTKEPTCRENGVQCYVCVNGCQGTKAETLVSKGNEHNWQYIEGEEAKIAALKCGQSVKVIRYCKEADCPASTQSKEYTVYGPNHEYYDVTIAANLEAIKALDKTTNPYIKRDAGTADEKIIVEYTTPGNCERGAVYKLTCVNDDCIMFKSFEINEGYKQGHKKTYISNSALAATCTMNGGSNKWYCSNVGCDYYRDDTAGTPVLPDNWGGRDTVYAANHYLWNSTTNSVSSVTYKNVPDARISGAASPTAAQLVEATVDANGIVIRAVAIEGTSLVWVYKYTAKNHTESTVSYGGFYCVDCKSYVGESATNIPTPAGHTYMPKTPVAATCQNYGYTLYECSCGDAYQTNYSKVSTHSYLFLKESNREAIWASLSSEQKEGRAYVAPSCSIAGYAIDVCTVCKTTATESISATGHRNKYGEILTTSCKDIPTERYCANRGCGFEIKKVHDFSNGICKVCGISQ